MRTDVYWLPGPWSGHLAIVPRPRGQDWLPDEARAWRDAGLDVVVSLLTPEEVVELELEEEAGACRQAGLEFHSLPIPDRDVPPSRARLAALVATLDQALAAGKNVAVHCRQGVGRSALVAAGVLACAGQEADDAFRSIAQARGVPVPDTPAQREWLAGFAATQGLPMAS